MDRGNYGLEQSLVRGRSPRMRAAYCLQGGDCIAFLPMGRILSHWGYISYKVYCVHILVQLILHWTRGTYFKSCNTYSTTEFYLLPFHIPGGIITITSLLTLPIHLPVKLQSSQLPLISSESHILLQSHSFTP